MTASEIISQAKNIRDELRANCDFADNRIDAILDPIPPFIGKESIKLIIIGQDPTIRNENSRQKIASTLNLDKPGALRGYLGSVCSALALSIDNVYATNVFKYFYSYPPQETTHVLKMHLDKNLELLQKEINSYPSIPVITLGLPVLQLLAGPESQVSYYWDYNKKEKITNGNFKYCSAAENRLTRDFFPLPHIRSMEKQFYKKALPDYLLFVATTIS